MNAIEATLKVLIDGQAVLYADVVQLRSGVNIFDPDQHETLQDEWKTETAKLIQELIDNEA